MNFTLLTHFKELPKRSNTGRLVVDVLGTAAEQVRWDRMNPPSGLVEEIGGGGVALVFPGGEDSRHNDLTGISRCIIVDGTWVEARRIYQRSPYLHNIRRICIRPDDKSRYNLRKNQKESCLCTAECVIEILRYAGNQEAAERLEQAFLNFIRPAGVMRGAVAKALCSPSVCP